MLLNGALLPYLRAMTHAGSMVPAFLLAFAVEWAQADLMTLREGSGCRDSCVGQVLPSSGFLYKGYSPGSIGLLGCGGVCLWSQDL